MRFLCLMLCLSFAVNAQTHTSSATVYSASKAYSNASVPYCEDANTASWSSWSSGNYQAQTELTVRGYINPSSSEYGCWNTQWTTQFILGFNTAFAGGRTILSAALYWKPVAKVKTSATPVYGLYIRTASSDSTSSLTYPMSAPPTANIVSNRSIDSISTGSYLQESVPAGSINGSGTTFIHFYYRGIPNIGYSYYGCNCEERITVGGPGSSGNKPYLVITLAGGARLIVVAEQ
ncbi:MAG TPA: hypothetical protein PKJ41_15460 [Bryobacteraceae bacterium]|nr:hypothetical protein [Bryobacteraceae bacterium]HPT28043.1 hypothetical protein [Bryobacteraceae bacterium]